MYGFHKEISRTLYVHVDEIDQQDYIQVPGAKVLVLLLN